MPDSSASDHPDHPHRDRRRGYTALLPSEYVGVLRIEFLMQYADDPAFVQRLHALVEAHRDVLMALLAEPWDVQWWNLRPLQSGVKHTPAVQAYYEDLNALAHAFGLDRFLTTKQYREAMDGRNPHAQGELAWVGFQAIHAFCMAQARGLTLTLFGAHAGYGSGRPEVGEVVSRTETPLPMISDGTMRFVWLVDERRAPILHYPEGERWYPATERRSDARRRLLAAHPQLDAHRLDAELDRIENEHREAGYAFYDTQPARHLHLYWLYQRVAYKKSCIFLAGITEVDRARRFLSAQFADATPDLRKLSDAWFEQKVDYNPESIRKMTTPLADLIGIVIPRPRNKARRIH